MNLQELKSQAEHASAMPGVTAMAIDSLVVLKLLARLEEAEAALRFYGSVDNGQDWDLLGYKDEWGKLSRAHFEKHGGT